MKQNLVDLRNIRGSDQQARYQESLDNGVCMFCRENIEQYHESPVIKEGENWYVIKNDWPYKHTRNHLLIVARQHWVKLEEITAEAMAELLEIWKRLEETFRIPGGALCFRFGDSKYNAASVTHLHAHIVVPNLTGPVKFTIGKDFSWKARMRRKARKWWWKFWG